MAGIRRLDSGLDKDSISGAFRTRKIAIASGAFLSPRGCRDSWIWSPLARLPPNGEPAGIGTKATVKKQIHISANASAKNTNSELADETRIVGSRDSAIMQAASDVRERCRGQGTNYTTPQRQRSRRSQCLVNAHTVHVNFYFSDYATQYKRAPLLE